MKKVFSIIAVIALIPHLVFASVWWNPLSWFDFLFPAEIKVNVPFTPVIHKNSTPTEPSLTPKAKTDNKMIVVPPTKTTDIQTPTALQTSVAQAPVPIPVLEVKIATTSSDSSEFLKNMKANADTAAAEQAEHERIARLQSLDCVQATATWDKYNNLTVYPLSTSNGMEQAKTKTLYINAKVKYEYFCNGTPLPPIQKCMYYSTTNDMICGSAIPCMGTDQYGNCVN